jgi:hypothetical protein
LIVRSLQRIIALGGKMATIPNSTKRELVVELPSQLQVHLDMALVRLQAIFIGCEFTRMACTISARLPDIVSEDDLRKAILHTVYREKIYAETLSMRQALVETLTAR